MNPSPVEIRILSQPRYLCVARAAIGAAVERIGFDDAAAGQVMLALDEALANIIRHGYKGRDDGPIWVRFAPIEDGRRCGFRLIIDDEAPAVNPEAIKGRDLEDVRPGGLGVHIIRKVMDHVEYSQRPGGGMRLVMTKIAAASTSPADDAQEGCTP